MSEFMAIFLSFFNVNLMSPVSPDRPASSTIVRPLQSPAVKRHFVIYHDGKISFVKTLERLFKAFCPRLCQDISECHDLQVGGRRIQRE